MGFSYSEGGNIHALALDGVVPSMRNIRDGSYELSRKLYFYTFGEPKAGAKAFIAFVMGPEGQKVAVENGFVPLAEAKVPQAAVNITPLEGKAPAPKQPGFQGLLACMALLAVSWAALKRRG